MTIDEFAGDYLFRPRAVTFGDRELFILDGGNFRVVAFSPSGAFLYSIGKRGAGPGELSATAMTFEDDIAVDGQHVAVLEVRTRRVHVFQKDGAYTRTLSVPLAGGISMHAGEVYVATMPVAPNEPLITRVDAASTQGLRLGERVGPPAGGSVGFLLNHGHIAVASDGEIGHVSGYWPRVAVYGPEGLNHEIWADLSWWGTESWIFGLLSQRMVLYADHADSPLETIPPMKTFYDIEYSRATNEWVTLLIGGTVQVFGRDLEAQVSYQLYDPDGSPARALTDIAVSRTGTTICAVEPFEHKVYCYRLAP